jgi:hypothetical protein
MQYLTRLEVGAKIFRTMKGGERSGQCTDVGRCLSLVLTGQDIKVCVRATPHHRMIGSTSDRGKGQYLFEIIPNSRDFRLPPRCKWGVRPSGMLHSVIKQPVVVTTATRCVIAPKSAVLSYFAVEALNHARRAFSIPGLLDSWRWDRWAVPKRRSVKADLRGRTANTSKLNSTAGS